MRIAVLDDYQGAAPSTGPWHELPGDVVATTLREQVADPVDPVRLLQGFEVVGAMRERTALPAALLAQLPDLRLLVTTWMQNAAIDVAAARRLGVTVCGTDNDLVSAVELTWVLVRAVSRHVAAEDAGLRAGGWQHTLGRRLSGDTLGLLGLGRIGSQVARIGQAFGMQVLAWSQNLTPERAAAAGAGLVDKDELLRRSDVVSLHLRLSDRTRGLLGARELALMKASAVPRQHLARSARRRARAAVVAGRGALRGAGLDVYAQEPLPVDSPLRSCPGVVLTPHPGYVTEQAYALYYGERVADVAAFRVGRPVRVLGEARAQGAKA